MTKNSKYCKADTYCWSCGYDCSRNHDSKTCEYKAPGHREAATGANPLGGSGWEQQANNIEKKEPVSTTEIVTSTILKTSINYKFNTNKLETPSINISFSNTTLVAICSDKFDSHMRHTIYNHNPDRYTARPVRSTIKSRQWHPVQNTSMKF
jgi:hypothetical protein